MADGTSLCRELVQLIEPDAVYCKNSKKNFTTVQRDVVAMRPWNLLNEVMRPKHSQQPGDASGAAPLLFRASGSAVEEQRLKIAIAESVDAEFAAADCPKQCQIRLGPRS